MTHGRKLETSRSLYFEECEPGLWFETPGRTVTEADVVTFSALSGDWNSIHSDVTYARNSHFGQRVAHGLLGLSIAEGLAVRTGFLTDTILAFRDISEWKFSQPIYLGDTIHVRATLIDAKRMPRLGGGLIAIKVEVLNQKDEVVQRGTWGALVKSRER